MLDMIFCRVIKLWRHSKGMLGGAPPPPPPPYLKVGGAPAPLAPTFRRH